MNKDYALNLSSFYVQNDLTWPISVVKGWKRFLSSYTKLNNL